VVHFLSPHPATDDLHRLTVFAVATDADLRYAGVAGGKERRVPGMQAIVRQRVVAALDRVVHDVEQAFHAARRLGAILLAHAQPPRDRTAHSGQVQALALDGRCRQRFLAPGLCRQHHALFEAQNGELALDHALHAARLAQGLADTSWVMPKIRPVRVLPKVDGRASCHSMRPT
jgi:hypothetical protein